MSTLHVNASISVEIIPLQELAKHNTKTDAWISIRGTQNIVLKMHTVRQAHNFMKN